MASLEHNIPITPDTVFDVASVSKQFTAFAIALLAKRGKLSLDDNVRKYVPELPEFGKPITVRHLVHHTSGLRDYGALLIMTGWRMDNPVNTADFINIFSKQKGLNFAPGEKFTYSNTNYGLLGMIVERVSGRSFTDFMKTEVFAPLGMKNTLVRSDPLTIVPNRASNYTSRKEGGYNLNYVWAFTKVMGPSSVHTTLEDLAKWDTNFYDERVGGAGIRELMYSPGMLNSGRSSGYAFGLFTDSYRGQRMITHTGAGGGSFVLTRFPDQKFSVAVLCNRYYTNTNAAMLAEKVANVFLADKFEEKKTTQTDIPVAAKEPPPKDELTRHAGIYWMEGSGNKITFAVNDGKLTTQYNNDKVFPLVYVSKGRFFNQDERLLYSFSETSPDIMSLEITVPGTTELYKADRRPQSKSQPEQLREYTGTYYSSELEISWSIDLDGGKLRIHRKGFEDKALEPSYLDGFYFTHSDETTDITYLLKFERAKNGKINQFTVSSGRLAGIVFTRTKQ
jgi:CubicO group peptidase (beta-lactamase class C family)